MDFTGHCYQARDCGLCPADLAPVARPCSLAATVYACYAWQRSPPICGMPPISMSPPSLVAPQRQLQAAYAEGGRDPVTIAVTTTSAMSYHALGAPDATMTDYLSEPPAEIVAALHSDEQMGVSHPMFQCFQYNEIALGWLAEALQEYRAQSSRKVCIAG